MFCAGSDNTCGMHEVEYDVCNVTWKIFPNALVFHLYL